ncbi:MAG TPA: ankyrin repeat domain-containing protein [Terriglobales bacterium]|nr:ankyrin repeat domain-containing protein [Terriglobales bacterium]
MPASTDVISAVHSGDLENLRMILQSDPSLASARDENGVSALMHAYYRRQFAIADLLLQSKLELDIFEATAAGNAAQVAAILQRNTEAARNWSADGFTALHFAAFFNRAEIARMLVRHGADVAAVARNAMQVTPLHSAAAAHSAEIVRLLVENGAPANSRQQGGWTALHEAAQIGDREMVKTLIEYGADRSVRSDDGRTPAQMAQAKGHEEIARMLLP